MRMESKTVTAGISGAATAPAELSRTVEYSADYLAQIVGEEGREGERLQAGPILKLLYDAGLSVALRHS